MDTVSSWAEFFPTSLASSQVCDLANPNAEKFDSKIMQPFKQLWEEHIRQCTGTAKPMNTIKTIFLLLP